VLRSFFCKKSSKSICLRSMKRSHIMDLRNGQTVTVEHKHWLHLDVDRYHHQLWHRILRQTYDKLLWKMLTCTMGNQNWDRWDWSHVSLYVQTQRWRAYTSLHLPWRLCILISINK
jgi:hypothetical protein